MDMVFLRKLAKRLESTVSINRIKNKCRTISFNSFKSNIVAPRIQPSGITLALLGDRVELKCVVKSKPSPKVIFWKDHEGAEPVPLGSNYEMTTDASSDVSKILNFFF